MLCEGEPISLQPKVFDALLILVESDGHLIKKADFLNQLWADSFVEEGTLTRIISNLRKVLGETAENKFIVTVPKSGYRFVVPVFSSVEDEILSSSLLIDAASEDDKTPTASVRDNVASTVSADNPIQRASLFERLKAERIMLLVLGALAGALVFWTWQNKPAKEIKSIAVLPFYQIGASERNAMLEFGMADTLITRLSNLREIAVRPSSAVSKYADLIPDVVRIGRELQVDAVLQGHIQQSADRIRVNVQLISTDDGTSLWAEQFDTEFTNIFAVQNSIAEKTVKSLSPQLSRYERDLVSRHPTENADAYQFYLMGRYFWNKRTAENLKKSIGFYEQALELDENFALAYAGLADSHQLLAEYSAIGPREEIAKAKDAAMKALAIDGRLTEAHTSLAYALAFHDWDWVGAEREFKTAIEMNPNYATAHQWYGEFLTAMGRFDEAKAEFEKAVKLDPTSLIIQTDMAAYFFITRQFDNSIEQSQRVIAMDSGFAYGYVFLWFSFGQKGMKLESANAYLNTMKLFGEEAEAEELRQIIAEFGTDAMWQRRVEQIDKPRIPKSVPAIWRAVIYLETGNKMKALDWFEKSFEERDRWIINLKHSPVADRIKSEPRFQRLVQRIGL